MLYYFLVFIGSLLVDLIPFVGPPAWTVMVFFQMRYDLNIWAVIVTGVIGSAIGRYLLSR
jgi:membrane protein DedA with SNARE-associated domain